jgi:hypothetical protein
MLTRILVLVGVYLASLLGWIPFAQAQTESVAAIDSRDLAMRAVRVPNGGITIDGVLDEEFWATEQPATDFRQTEPLDGEPSGARTEAWVVYDESNLYVGARMYEPNVSEIVRQLTPRDDTPPTVDYIDISIDPDYDRTSAYLFRVTASGVQRDEFLHHDTEPDAAWNSTWESAVGEEEDAWTAEIRIPLSQIRVNPSADSQTWGVDFIRRRATAGERSIWAWRPRTVNGRVSRFAQLQNMLFPEQERLFEVIPYVMGRLDVAPSEADNPFFSGKAWSSNAGVDIRYGLGATFIVDATINPDFGQVDADPKVINLTAFETELEEHRPFFTRDDRIFDFRLSGGDLIQSRRIGRAPQGPVPDGYDFHEVPLETSILGAAKVTGTTNGGLTIGVLGALTAREFGRAYKISTDETIRFEVEPQTIYGVVRAQQDWRGGQSHVGVTGTMVRRDLPGDGTLDLLPSQAYSGGVNFVHTWGDREWTLWGFLAGTHVQGSTEAITRLQRSSRHYFQRPDQNYLRLDPTRTSLSGLEWRIEFERLSAEHWTGAIWLAQRTPGYDPNDIGFYNATERLDGGVSLTYSEPTPGDVFRNYSISATTVHNWRHSAAYDVFSADAWGHAHKAGRFTLETEANFMNYWSFETDYTYRPAMLSDTLTRGGPLMVNPGSHNFTFAVNSDPRQFIAIEFENTLEDNLRGGGTILSRVGLNARPTNGLTLNLDFQYEAVRDTRQFVSSVVDPSYFATYGSRYFFGNLHRKEFSIEAGVDWILSPTLSIRAFARPLFSSGEFRAYKQLALAGNFDFNRFSEGEAVVTGETVSCVGGTLCRDQGRIHIDYSGDGMSDASFRDQNFNVNSMIGSVVVRWEYSPGSQLFFVWQQNREYRDTFGDFDLQRDARSLFENRGEHAFIIKATRWFNL